MKLVDLARSAKSLLPARLAAAVDARLAATSAEQRSAGRTALSAFSVRVAGAAIAYLSQILLARWMGIFEYGIFVVVYVWITVLSQVGNLGFSSAVIRFVPEYRARGELARMWGILRASRLMAVAFATLLSSAGAGLVWFVPGLVDDHYVVPILLGAVCLPLFCLTDVQDGIARSFDWPDLAFGPTFIWRPLAVLAAMTGAHLLDLPMTAVTACLATILACWGTAMVQLLLIGRRLGRGVTRAPADYDMRTWIVVALPILLSDGFYAMLTSVDVLMVSKFGTPEDVAVYYAATKTLALVHFVYFAVRAASGPRFSYHYHADNRDELERLVRSSVRWTFWPSVAVSAVVLILGEFLLALFGDDFTGGRSVMVILVLGILARASVGPVETLLTMAGHQKSVAALFGATLAVNVVLNLLLIPPYGLEGAASAMAIAMFVEAFLVATLVRRRLGLRIWIFQVHTGEPAPRPAGRTAT